MKTLASVVCAGRLSGRSHVSSEADARHCQQVSACEEVVQDLNPT